MLENEELVNQFKKTISATIKSIGKSEDIEVEFVESDPKITGRLINLTEPKISSLKKKLNYYRAEADAMALEIRLHDPKVHNKYLSNNEISNQIFNVIEKSRIEAQGSNIFKGIKMNILNKNNVDLENSDIKKSENIDIVKAFRYVSFSELTSQKLDGKYIDCYNFIKKKLGKNYDNYFNDLRNKLEDQEKFANQIQSILDELGFLYTRGADLKIITDNSVAAAAISEHSLAHQVLIEVDCGEHRTGVRADGPQLLELAALISASGRSRVMGILTHAGHSYACRSGSEVAIVAETERRAAVQAAQRLSEAGYDTPIISVGSTPTATHGKSFDGITEVRPGVYMFQDLFQDLEKLEIFHASQPIPRVDLHAQITVAVASSQE